MTTTRFFNAHLCDPSQSIDGVGYIDIAGRVITAINLGTPPMDNKIERVIDCKKAILASSRACFTNAKSQSSSIPRADSTSAAPLCDDTALLPCLATGMPHPATTKALAVEIL